MAGHHGGLWRRHQLSLTCNKNRQSSGSSLLYNILKTWPFDPVSHFGPHPTVLQKGGRDRRTPRDTRRGVPSTLHWGFLLKLLQVGRQGPGTLRTKQPVSLGSKPAGLH